MHNSLEEEKLEHANSTFILGVECYVKRSRKAIPLETIQYPLSEPYSHLGTAVPVFLAAHSQGQISHHLPVSFGPYCCTLPFDCANTDGPASRNWK